MLQKNLLFILIITSVSCEDIDKSKIITIDTHDDINTMYFTDSLNYTMDTDTKLNLPKMIAGGLDVAWLVVYTAQGELNDEGYAAAMDNAIDKFDAIDRLVNKYAPSQIELALSSDDVRRIHAKGKKVAMIGIENAYPMGLDTSNVRKYWERGARYVSLAHNGHSQFSDSNTGEFDGTALHNGLSDLGKEMVSLLNYYGVMIDISHPSKEAIKQMIALSDAPVIASHSSARALRDHPRNLDDEQLELIKNNGGVIQTTALGSFLTDRKDPPPNMSDFMDHIDYMVEKIGIDHVGISSDFDGGGGIVGWNDASETMNVTKELRERGYSESEIEKLWGANLLRVLDEVQAISSKLQSGEL
ncbi:MAG: membrane dipeptidase [Flavobacteriaceae bacterium]|nr:membrane dipeptidase [Flavobacteriaceae bacterium]